MKTVRHGLLLLFRLWVFTWSRHFQLIYFVSWESWAWIVFGETKKGVLHSGFHPVPCYHPFPFWLQTILFFRRQTNTTTNTTLTTRRWKRKDEHRFTSLKPTDPHHQRAYCISLFDLLFSSPRCPWIESNPTLWITFPPKPLYLPNYHSRNTEKSVIFRPIYWATHPLGHGGGSTGRNGVG